MISKSLSTLPNLKQLRIDIPSNNVQLYIDQLLSHLPKLEILNDKPLQQELKLNDLTITLDIDNIIPNIDFATEITNYNAILQQLTLIDKHINNNINDGFRSYISTQMNTIDKLIKANLPNYAYGIHVLKIKCELYNYLQKKVIALLKDNNNNNVILSTKKRMQCINVLENINNKITEKENEMVMIVDALQCTLHNEGMKNIVNSNDILKENKNLKSTIKEHIKSKNALEESNKLLRSKCGKMQQENELMTSQLLKSAYKLAGSNNNGSSNSNSNTNCFNSFNNNNNNSNNCSSNHFKHSSSLTASPSHNKISKSFINNTNTNSYYSSYRQLSQEGLLELISEIYKSKSIANKKNTSIGKPLDTMEQHMYTFLQNKYGLKTIITDVASAIISSIKQHAKLNSEIRLFGLILQNEIEEKSIQILTQIKSILNESLITVLQLDNPYKTQTYINTLVTSTRNTFIQEHTWLRMISLIFQKDKTAETTITRQIYAYINTVLNKSLNTLNRSYSTLTRSERDLMNGMKTYQKKITYKDLFNIILGYHLKSRDAFLKRFKICFKQIDTLNKGILTKNEFYTLIINLNLFDNDCDLNNNIDKLVMKLPHCEAYNAFSFSEIVDVLENETSLKVPELNCLEFISSNT